MEFRDRESRKDEMRRFGRRIEESLLAGDDQLFTDYLRQIGKALYHYSVPNSFLIMMQRPRSRLVGSKSRFHELAKEQGHQGRECRSRDGKRKWTEYIRPGKDTKAAFVWCPRTFTKTEIDPKTGEEKEVTGVYFNPGDVWAIEDIRYWDTGKEVEMPDFVPNLQDAGDVYEALCAVALERGLTPKEEAIGGGLRGYNYKKDVVVDERDEVGKKCLIMAHELAHGVLNHQEKHAEIPKGQRESEAELAGAVVLFRFGYDITSASVSYLKTYGTTAKELRATLERIQEVAEEVADAVAEKLEAKAQAA